jgi:hypothetical protein
MVRVSVSRGGGFGGLVRTSTADTDRLSARDGRQLTALVKRAGLAGGPAPAREAPPEPGPKEPGPDRFIYAVIVEDQGQTRQARFSERSLPAEVRNLISWVGSVSGHEDDIEPPGGRTDH